MIKLHAEACGRLYRDRFPDLKCSSVQSSYRRAYRERMSTTTSAGKTQWWTLTKMKFWDSSTKIYNSVGRAEAADLSINKDVVQTNNWRPYGMVLVQELQVPDFERRCRYCTEVLGILREDPDMFQHYWATRVPSLMMAPSKYITCTY